jgi:hypothetical protein
MTEEHRAKSRIATLTAEIQTRDIPSTTANYSAAIFIIALENRFN